MVIVFNYMKVNDVRETEQVNLQLMVKTKITTNQFKTI